MARRGPKPKGGSAANPLPGRPKPPAILDKEAKLHWAEVVELVEEAGTLSRLDRDALTLYCSLWSTWREAEREMVKPTGNCPAGRVIRSNNGYFQTSPWYTIAVQALKDMRPFLDAFGLTPKARAKLRLPEPEEDAGGKWEGLV